MFVYSLLKRNFYWFWFISLGMVSCNNAKYTQCQQIIELANQVNHQTQEVINQPNDLIEPQMWSQAVNIMNQAASQIETLSLEDPQIINYQKNLVKIFRAYAEATNDAIQARENKNLKALKSAVEKAQETGVLKDKLVIDLNNYCLGEPN